VESLRAAYGLGRKFGRKAIPMLLLAAMCLPALIMVMVVTLTGLRGLPVSYATYLVNVQVLAAIFVAAQAPVLVSRDLRSRVVTLYFSRPLDRARYVQAKFIAMAVATFAVLAAPLLVLFLGTLLAKLPIEDQLPDFLRALGIAVGIAVLLAGIALLIAAVVPRRGLGVAAIVAVLLVSGGVQGALRAIGAEVDADALVTYSPLVSPFTIVDTGADYLFDAGSGLSAGPQELTTGLIFAATWLALVAGTYFLLVLRYRKVSVS
jgi:ABC-2 type transport system permease protein